MNLVDHVIKSSRTWRVFQKILSWYQSSSYLDELLTLLFITSTETVQSLIIFFFMLKLKHLRLNNKRSELLGDMNEKGWHLNITSKYRILTVSSCSICFYVYIVSFSAFCNDRKLSNMLIMWLPMFCIKLNKWPSEFIYPERSITDRNSFTLGSTVCQI